MTLLINAESEWVCSGLTAQQSVVSTQIWHYHNETLLHTELHHNNIISRTKFTVDELYVHPSKHSLQMTATALLFFLNDTVVYIQVFKNATIRTISLYSTLASLCWSETYCIVSNITESGQWYNNIMVSP